MKFTAAAVAAIAGVATAAPAPTPFHLEISSSDKSLNGKRVGTCHAGAAIEAACISDKGSPFLLKTDEGAQSPIKGVTVPSSLLYTLPTQQPITLSLTLVGAPSSNTQEGIFEQTDTGAFISFNQDEQATGIISYLNDTVSPPNGQKPAFYQNWYVCETYYQSYTYQTLAWVPGSGKVKPENPSCKKVKVIRTYQ